MYHKKKSRLCKSGFSKKLIKYFTVTYKCYRSETDGCLFQVKNAGDDQGVVIRLMTQLLLLPKCGSTPFPPNGLVVAYKYNFVLSIVALAGMDEESNLINVL